MSNLLIIAILFFNLTAKSQYNLNDIPDSPKAGKVALIMTGSFIVGCQVLKIVNLEFKEDKINHFSCGYIIGYGGNLIGYKITKNKTIGLISGVILSSLAGHLKEKYDSENEGIYNKKDLLNTSLGGIEPEIDVVLNAPAKVVTKVLYLNKSVGIEPVNGDSENTLLKLVHNVL